MKWVEKIFNFENARTSSWLMENYLFAFLGRIRIGIGKLWIYFKFSIWEVEIFQILKICAMKCLSFVNKSTMTASSIEVYWIWRLVCFAKKTMLNLYIKISFVLDTFQNFCEISLHLKVDNEFKCNVISYIGYFFTKDIFVSVSI